MTEKNTPHRGLMTDAVHAGETPDPVTRASAPGIVTSTTFLADAGASFSAEDFGDATPYLYSRWKNPTVDQLEQKLAALEGAEAAVAFGSGMAAVTALLLYNLSAGDHLVISDVSYAATAEMTNELIPRLGISVTKVDMSDPENLRDALRPNTRLVYAETPANPILRLTDIEAVAGIAHENGSKVAVDATFASPIGIHPLELGADYVIHSLTKYICGHGDAIGGAVLGNRKDMAGIRKEVEIRTGGILSPFNAWLIQRGASTLPLRMKAHETGALAVAKFLEDHPKVTRVVYPGLASHPQHALAARQLKNFSGMLTFQVADGANAAKILADRLSIIHYAVSLGHVRSLVFYLPTDEMLRTSFRMTPAQERSYRAFAGDGIFRLSVGLEDPEDLCADLEYALAGVPSTTPR
ncbi:MULTISPECIES: trans-sulfuration enzyme family protein [unclassified Methanoculleus]|uniref:PLP-dependent aspartate aminotransferase family protein n=1 Tax=Methanoculleus palmolei TaxID=72612 RepID=A0ABD8A9K3_9EURY|nr:PLP-dependent aspartate aminotransferase family protein [Methanoculleus sp. UBA377]MDD2473193.1 PLP-dependent aspartate aminotransferase family protein [Methanoculleus sp.]WOX55800.1 PLP-dependent aspartate aminotransferase family protein [Methanoculleus palmolei]